MMNRLSCTMLFKALIFTSGSIAVSASQNEITPVSSAAATQNERDLMNNPLLDNWGKEEGLAAILNEMIESAKTTSPTLGPTTENPTSAPTTENPTAAPTDHPTSRPTLSPSEFPSNDPTASPSGQPSLSFHPSSQPSSHPTASPSVAPSVSAVPTAVPSRDPSEMPSNTPSTSPTPAPSSEPSEMPSDTPSVSPNGAPSREPSEMPSDRPSFSPTESPSREPSLGPSNAPTISHKPTFVYKPSSNPSIASTLKPSSGPSEAPSVAPTLPPSTSPSTLSPTESIPPSESPTESKAMESSIMINKNNTRNTMPLLIVGAACFVVMASTGLFLFRRGSQSRDRKLDSTPSMIEVSAGDPKNGSGIISPYSIEAGLDRSHSRHRASFEDDVMYSASSESHGMDGDNTLEYNYATGGQQHYDNEGELEDVDLEAGGIDDVPNSVSIIKRTQSPSIDEDKTIDEPSSPGNSRLRMPKSIYVPKMFQRTKEENENSKEIITWNQIREEEDRSHASSGYAPASASSLMLSPFFVKGLSSILSPTFGGGNTRGAVPLNGSSCDETEEDEAVVATTTVTGGRPTSMRATREENRGRGISPVREIVLRREAPQKSSDDVFAGLEDTPINNNGIEDGSAEQKSLGGKSSSDGSSIEWGIDVSKVEQPSKATFEANMAELQNILVSIKSMGSKEAPDEDVNMTYTESVSAGPGSPESSANSSDQSDQMSPESEASSPRNSHFDIAPIESSSEASSLPSSFHSPPQKRESGITYERELLNSNRTSGQGTFNFRNIFNDPKNDLYQCHAPSGPLGIVVDTTPLGPRVRSLNPLSPIFGLVSPGDVIVGVDEVDTVGMEAGDFWQVVSRKANQQERFLTILRI